MSHGLWSHLSSGESKFTKGVKCLVWKQEQVIDIRKHKYSIIFLARSQGHFDTCEFHHFILILSFVKNKKLLKISTRPITKVSKQSLRTVLKLKFTQHPIYGDQPNSNNSHSHNFTHWAFPRPEMSVCYFSHPSICVFLLLVATTRISMTSHPRPIDGWRR